MRHDLHPGLGPATRPPLQSLLVANRGEVLRRVSRTARALGLRVSGVYTSEDASHSALSHLDAAVLVPDYLNGAAIVQAALDLGCDAVHPGYGFLSEDAAFARQVIDAGLVWVGPTPAAIAAMGSKASSRRLAVQLGVPVAPGSDPAVQDDAGLLQAAATIGFPLLVKAAAGGGGKGMLVVAATDALPAALASARRLALSAFGDGTLLLERCLQPARHVEVQVLGDQHGTVIALGERECSLQRRHQKVIEESPAPAFAAPDGEARRQSLVRDALLLARAVGYQSAGTVEFVIDAQGAHYLLEMNTRLQVEHPVTELVWDVDLVALQLGIAEGRALDPTAFGPPRGHAIEARLYAEDPLQGDLPAPGTLARWSWPAELRVDSGVEEGDTIGASYDPMLAKLVAWGPDRAAALQRLRRGLERGVALGPATNRGLLLGLLGDPAVQAGALHTGLIAAHRDRLAAPPSPEVQRLATQVVVALDLRNRRAASPLLPGLRPGWRLLSARDAQQAVLVEGQARTLSYRPDPRDPDRCVVDGCALRLHFGPAGLSGVAVDGRRWPVAAAPVATGVWALHIGGSDLRVALLPDHREPEVSAPVGRQGAPMPGRVVRLPVAVGDVVAAGDVLCVIEAMKMEQPLYAATAGTVRALRVQVGAQVAAGDPLVELEPLATTEARS